MRRNFRNALLFEKLLRKNCINSQEWKLSSTSRRSFLAALPILTLAKCAIGEAKAPDFPSIERRCKGKLGAFVLDTGTGRTLSWRADERFPFCSSTKGPLAAFVLWKADHGQLDLNQPVQYGESDLLSYAPITRAAVAKGALTLAELCGAAVSFSDNTAANLLWRETGGPEALTAWMRNQGDEQFQLSSNEPGLNLSHFGDGINTTTPHAMAQSYSRFVLGNVLSVTAREKLTTWLLANTTGAKRLRAGLPPSWRIGDKTGTYNEKWFSTVDVGVVWPKGRPPLVISGFVTDTPDTASAEASLEDLARQVAGWV